ncbi:hypothetical protein HID58_084159, partial [Brassica napus]
IKMGDTMGHKHQLQKSVPVKNHNHLGSGGLRRPGAPPLRDLSYNTRQMQQNSWQMSKGEDQMPFFSGRASSGTGKFVKMIRRRRRRRAKRWKLPLIRWRNFSRRNGLINDLTLVPLTNFTH